MKVGDSISKSRSFLHCFAGDNINLADREDLRETWQFFRDGEAAGTTPFDRESRVVEIGQTADWAVSGQPSPLQAEIDALNPALAVVMFGTNDCGHFAPDTARMLPWYGQQMFALVDTLLSGGIVPILMTIPPSTASIISRLDGTINAIIRGIAQGHQIPFVDYHREMALQPGLGLSPDGVHPFRASVGACQLEHEHLHAGYNLRNLLTLDALDRVRRVAMEDAPPTEDEVPLSKGSGTVADPIAVDGLPFTRMRDLSTAPTRDRVIGCGATPPTTGAEETYTLSLEVDTPLRIFVLEPVGETASVAILPAFVDDSTCIAHGEALIEGTLAAGSYRVVVNAPTDTASTYLVVMTPCDPTDRDCAPRLIHTSPGQIEANTQF